jgi:hypothetical protein
MRRARVQLFGLDRSLQGRGPHRPAPIRAFGSGDNCLDLRIKISLPHRGPNDPNHPFRCVVFQTLQRRIPGASIDPAIVQSRWIAECLITIAERTLCVPDQRDESNGGG